MSPESPGGHSHAEETSLPATIPHPHLLRPECCPARSGQPGRSLQGAQPVWTKLPKGFRFVVESQARWAAAPKGPVVLPPWDPQDTGCRSQHFGHCVAPQRQHRRHRTALTLSWNNRPKAARGPRHCAGLGVPVAATRGLPPRVHGRVCSQTCQHLAKAR